LHWDEALAGTLLLKSHFYKGLYTPYLTAVPHLPADFIAGVRVIARI